MEWFKDVLKERNSPLSKIARELEMEFHSEENQGLLGLMKGFKLFRFGNAKKIKNLMIRKDEWLESKAMIFDYQYTINTNNSSHTYRQTVFFIQSKQLGLPDLLIKPETFFHKIGTFLGMQDIDFIEDPEFSEKNLVQGSDEELIRSTLSEEIMRFFTIENNWTLEGVNYYFLFYQKNKLLDPNQIKTFYHKGMKLFEWLKAESL